MKSIKRIANLLAAVAFAIAASCTLTSCGDDDEPENTESSINSARIDAVFYVNKDALDMYDIEAITPTGNKLSFPTAPTTVTINSTEYQLYGATIIASSETLPVVTDVDVTYKLKDGYQIPEKSDIVLYVAAEGFIDCGCPYADKKYVDSRSIINIGIDGNKIEQYTDYINSAMGHINVVLDESGLSISTIRNTEE